MGTHAYADKHRWEINLREAVEYEGKLHWRFFYNAP